MSARLDEIYRPIRKDLNRVELFLNNELKTSSDPFPRLNASILNNPGKRLRPALTLLSAYSVLEKKQNERFNKKVITLATAIELIHTASLTHDDVVDHSRLRRHQPTINTAFSNETAIAFGDYLYSKGLNLLASLKGPEIISSVTGAALDMCEGELTQILNRGNFQLKRQTYMTIVKKKTAHLMSSSCSAPIILINKKDALIEPFSSFGLNFGIAFQIIDDCLDLIGGQKELRKSTGLDLKAGEFTLPFLFLMESKVFEDTKELRELIDLAKIDSRKLQDIRNILLDSDSLVKSKKVACGYIEKAKDDLGVIKNSIFKEKLMDLADFTLERLASEDISPRHPA